MAIFFHGTSALFSEFDLSHALEGDGKVKFGYGVYLTCSFKSAALYSGANKTATEHYVYTVEIPDLTDDNHIDFKKPVPPDIVGRAENKLGFSIPDNFISYGKDFRKYLAKKLGGGSDIDSEKLASEFLNAIGVEFITWPFNWKKPEAGLNLAVLDAGKINIVKIQDVKLDTGKRLLPGSEREVSP